MGAFCCSATFTDIVTRILLSKFQCVYCDEIIGRHKAVMMLAYQWYDKVWFSVFCMLTHQWCGQEYFLLLYARIFPLIVVYQRYDSVRFTVYHMPAYLYFQCMLTYLWWWPGMSFNLLLHQDSTVSDKKYFPQSVILRQGCRSSFTYFDSTRCGHCYYIENKTGCRSHDA